MNDRAVASHYDASGDASKLVEKVTGLLDSLPGGPLSVAQLAGLDQFHVRGLAATAELAGLAGVEPGMKILDAGCGLGGPSRYLADTFGARVLGIDLTPSFVSVARVLGERSTLAQGAVTYEVGNLLDLPAPDESFDLVWTQHVIMNVSERERAYRELRRVLRPGGKLAFYDAIAGGESHEPYFPLPWSETPATNYLLTKPATIDALAAAGFTLQVWKDVTAEAIDAIAALASSVPGPLNLVHVMGLRFAGMAANLLRSLREGRVLLAMGVFALPG